MTEHTPTPWERDGRTVYALKHHGWLKGAEIMENRFSLSIQGLAPESELEANAAFIVKAVNEYQKDKEVIADLIKALKAQLQMRDMKKPRKLEEELSWRDNDDLANKWAQDAIAKAEAL